MTHEEIFGRAKWIGTNDESAFPIIVDKFTAKRGECAEITILGFGVFVAFLNGERIHREEYLPLTSEFEDRHYPPEESYAPRAYAESFDLTPFIKDGENILTVALGDGPYNAPLWENKENRYGNKKLCYRISFDSGREHLSGPDSAGWVPYFVTAADYWKGESQDLRMPAFDLSSAGEWVLNPLIEERALETNYSLTDCPRDIAKEILPVKLVHEGEGYKIYDFGINTVGYPTLRVGGECGAELKLRFSEELTEDGNQISEEQSHGQHLTVISDGKGGVTRPVFGWIAARYAEVVGDGEIISFTVVRADVDATAEFDSDEPVLNFLNRAFINTYLTNIHSGMPSDCPHIERRGYTGDGQLVCHAGMLLTDSKRMYRKWMQDILDCQDRNSGHVQYTAPYTRSGGGPGGWGSAIVKVPYEYYLRYGDDSLLRTAWDGMWEYLRYLDDHSECDLVTSDRKGQWCLGEWCVPTPIRNDVILPAPFVNNYFYVKACYMMMNIAVHLGERDRVSELYERAEKRKRAITAAYFNTWNDSFLANKQGASAFALDIGLGTEKTKQSFIEYYERLGYFDTGIFGTEIVTRLLFEYGRPDIAIKLLTAKEPHGFGRFMELGASTLWEYWGVARSHSHPMFGAVTAHLYDYILGIRQTGGSVGYTDLVIEPRATEIVKRASGSIAAGGGKLSVAYQREGTRLAVTVTVPSGVKADFCYGGRFYKLKEGENTLTFEDEAE